MIRSEKHSLFFSYNTQGNNINVLSFCEDGSFYDYRTSLPIKGDAKKTFISYIETQC